MGSLFIETVAMIIMIKCGISIHWEVQSSEIDGFGDNPSQLPLRTINISYVMVRFSKCNQRVKNSKELS